MYLDLARRQGTRPADNKKIHLFSVKNCHLQTTAKKIHRRNKFSRRKKATLRTAYEKGKPTVAIKRKSGYSLWLTNPKAPRLYVTIAAPGPMPFSKIWMQSSESV